MPFSQPQLATNLLSPNHPLRLHDTKISCLASSLQLLQRVSDRLIGVQVANGHPLFVAPLFDSKKSVCHRFKMLGLPDPGSATRPARYVNYNQSAMAGVAAIA